MTTQPLSTLEFITGTYDIKTTKDFTLTVNDTTVIKVKADGSIEITAPRRNQDHNPRSLP